MQLKTIKPRIAALLAFAACAGCATARPTVETTLSVWSKNGDCFDRNVVATTSNAESMSLACAGPNGAANPRRSGIDRATAYFNAASAFNLLAQARPDSAACDSSAGCYRTSLDLMERSILSQDDELIVTDGTTAEARQNRLFRLRRNSEFARALAGAARTSPSRAPCGTAERCLATASSRLGSVDLVAHATADSQEIATAACRAIDLSADIYLQRGAEFEHAAMTDLRTLIRLCPDEAGMANSRLAAIAFSKGQQFHASMQQRIAAGAPPAEALTLGTSALSSYRDALEAQELRLAANRNIGEVLFVLATLEPTNAAAHFSGAIEAFDAAQTMSALGQPVEHAQDLTLLARAHLNLAGAQRTQDPLVRETHLNAAIRSAELAVQTAASPTRRLVLGEAYAEAGRTPDAISAYKTALKEAGARGSLEATLSLARLLEASGRSDEALVELERAPALISTAPEILFEKGRMRFHRRDHSQALEALTPASTRLSKDKAAEAHYMISVSEAALRRNGWQSRAREHADLSLQSGNYAGKYIRQDCLSHVLSGGRDVKTGASIQRCPVTGTPESYLLRGLYFLRQAQLVDVSAYNKASQDHWRSVLALADEAFQSGRESLKSAPAGSGKSLFEDIGREIDLGEEMSRGLAIVSRCLRQSTIAEGSEAWAALEAFYGHYGLLRCSDR